MKKRIQRKLYQNIGTHKERIEKRKTLRNERKVTPIVYMTLAFLNSVGVRVPRRSVKVSKYMSHLEDRKHQLQ